MSKLGVVQVSARPATATEQQVCVVIPCYRHVAPLKGYIDRVLKHSLPVILVDDGNSFDEAKELAELVDTLPSSAIVSLLRLDENRGKGAAVLEGIREAQRQGFTHVLQIDADAQHCAEDIPVFLRASSENPQALILGSPVFDNNAPKSRVWGRKLTTAMIALQTWSLSVADGLFGFRIYPVAEVIAVLENNSIEERMGFDVEILVRLLWRGCAVVNIESNVSYPKDGVSNFNYLRDNIVLTALHTRLFLIGLICGPIGRIRLLRRPKSPKWFEKKERGSRFALQLVMLLYRFGGRSLLELLLFPVIFYFYCTDSVARKGSSQYLKQLKEFYPEAKIPKFGATYFHLHRFGQKIISSLEAWRGEYSGSDIYWGGRQKVASLIEAGQGGLVISAHVGCLDVCRATHKERKGFTIVPLMYIKNALKFRNFLEQIAPESSLEVLAVDEIHAGVAMEIRQRIARGEFIAILADRQALQSPGRTVEVSFLGKKTQLPEGPFALAKALDCPVFTFFACYSEERKQYDAWWEELPIPQPKARSERRAALAEMAQEYTKRLEEVCRKSPLQWFNFYDYWGTK
ncbi:UNVERIFIED_CONTAM: hypothetical protein GTU68_055227 [Idotea baltica]|nr:hypothetical protein [Idotea baltica]